MANLMDYIDWRGDLTMEVSPFNEVDNLVLSHMTYVNFENIVPSLYEGGSISIRSASELFFQMYVEEVIEAQLTLTKMSAYLLRKMAQSHRFAQMKLTNYINIIDPLEMKQFSAITIELGDGTIYVAYRGTDNTIVGWKENFNMTFMSPVPAQMEAAIYLRETAGKTSGKLRVGGHSKGGNLAVYAAVIFFLVFQHHPYNGRLGNDRFHFPKNFLIFS